MTLLPKEPGVHDLSKIRPISLFEIIRKLLAGMVTTRVQKIWHAHGLLHPHQHGIRTQHGTHTAILQVLNHLEHMGGTTPTHLTFWALDGPLTRSPNGYNGLLGRDLLSV
jgi:hypothetical protein